VLRIAPPRLSRCALLFLAACGARSGLSANAGHALDAQPSLPMPVAPLNEAGTPSSAEDAPREAEDAAPEAEDAAPEPEGALPEADAGGSVVCEEMGGGAAGPLNGECSVTFGELCGSTSYQVTCGCPDGYCVCFGPTTHVVRFSGCPYCPGLSTQAYVLCGFPEK
jgi:hypothetical protein